MPRPRVFVGSSIKGLDIARHARAALTYDADVELWEDALFKSTNVPVENLVHLIEQYDFALFILHPEDKATIRNEDEVTVRDNVIFELGLFLAKLGRSRVFFIAPQQPDRTHRDWLYLPTDRRRERTSLVKNRMREICTSGS
jgi:predicted nucleotide-binding protein